MWRGLTWHGGFSAQRRSAGARSHRLPSPQHGGAQRCLSLCPTCLTAPGLIQDQPRQLTGTKHLQPMSLFSGFSGRQDVQLCTHTEQFGQQSRPSQQATSTNSPSFYQLSTRWDFFPQAYSPSGECTIDEELILARKHHKPSQW